jgi:hypothetical protein
VIGDSDFGWGDGEGPHGLGALSSAVLVVSSGLYCASVWLVSGLQPFSYLAARTKRSHAGEGIESVS